MKNDIYIKNKYEIEKLTNITEIKHLLDNSTNNNIFISNVDKYISFLKDKIKINKEEIIIISYLSIDNKYMSILCKNIFFKKLIFKKILMNNYKKNLITLNNYIPIKKRSFNSLIKHINKTKKRTYVYFENIDENNMPFYIPIIMKLEGFN